MPYLSYPTNSIRIISFSTFYFIYQTQYLEVIFLVLNTVSTKRFLTLQETLLA